MVRNVVRLETAIGHVPVTSRCQEEGLGGVSEPFPLWKAACRGEDESLWIDRMHGPPSSDSACPLRLIKRVQFGVLSPDELVGLCLCARFFSSFFGHHLCCSELRRVINIITTLIPCLAWSFSFSVVRAPCFSTSLALLANSRATQ